MFLKNLNLVLLLCLAALFANTANAETSVGELEITSKQGVQQTALLLDTHISGEINGMVATIQVEQQFQNTTNDWVNGRYVFPLPEGAAVDSLRLVIGDRIINGVVKEKQQAKQIFEQAKRQGKKAGLLQQHRPNLFSIAVANIAPNEKVSAKLSYVDRVHFENGIFSTRLPTTLTPRYIPGTAIKLNKQAQQALEESLNSNNEIEINSQHGWSANTDRVPDANHITPPQAHTFADQTTHHFTLSLSLNSGMTLQSLTSDSHQIDVSQSESKQKIQLSNGKEKLNKDLILSWQPTANSAPQAALFQQKLDGDLYAMLMLTPPQVEGQLSLPRDVTFIIDSSGSMAGESIRQAQSALIEGLNYLTGNDKFNIVDFDSSFTPLFEKSEPVSAGSLAKAKKMISYLRADGGTEMLGALNYALKQPSNNGYLRQIVFITDGAIGNERELFTSINSNLGDARLFTIGIGSAPNSFFMSKTASYGRGSYTYINDLNSVSNKMAELFKKITSPLMRDIKIDWGESVEQYPARIPDLYKGEPIVVLVKANQAPSKLTVSGNMLNTPWQQKLRFNNKQANNAENLDTLWARQKIASLMDKLNTGEQTQEQVKPEVIELGVKHQIVSQFTSFVAVEEVISKPQDQKAKHNNVPNRMPKGNTMQAPQTATPATLLSLSGLLLIGLALLIRRRSMRKPSTSKTVSCEVVL